MADQNHKTRHKELHKMLNELVADYIVRTGKLIGNTTVMELVQWSFEQTKKPTVQKK